MLLISTLILSSEIAPSRNAFNSEALYHLQNDMGSIQNSGTGAMFKLR